MRGVKEYPIEYIKGMERDGNPMPRDRDPMSLYTAKNVRVGNVAGTAEKFGGRAAIYTTAYGPGAPLPGHVLGLYEARIIIGGVAGDYPVVALSTNDLTTQTIGQLTYAAGAWTFYDIKRAAYAPQCPINRRFSFAVLNDLLIISDYGVSNLEKWAGGNAGAVKTAALTIGGSPGFTTLKAKYLQTVAGYLFVAYTTEDATVFPDRIRWCNAGLPETWSSNDRADLSTKDGDINMGLSKLEDVPIAFRRNSIWAGTFVDTSVGYRFSQQVAGKGTISPWSLVSVGNYIFFIWMNGVYVYDGTALPKRVSGKKVSDLFVSTIMRSEDDAYQVVGCKHPEKNEIWFCSQKDQYPTWIYNYQTDDWFYSTLKFEALSVVRRTQRATWDSLATEVDRHTWDSIAIKDGDRTWDKAFNIISGTLFLGGGPSADTTQATVYQADIGSYYDKNTSITALTATLRTHLTDCGIPSHYKRFAGATLRFVPFDATLTVRVFIDGIQVEGDKTVVVNSGVRDYVEKEVYFHAVGKTIQLEIENATSAESFRLIGCTIRYIPREAIK